MKLRLSHMIILSWFAKHSTSAWQYDFVVEKSNQIHGEFGDTKWKGSTTITGRKDYWCAEAYARVTFLIGMMHLVQSFAYWLPIHNIGELGLVWGAVVCASSLSAAVWIMFRMDVLPSHGGVFPIEIGGPIIETISLALAYTHHPTPGVLDISRTLVNNFAGKLLGSESRQ